MFGLVIRPCGYQLKGYNGNQGAFGREGPKGITGDDGRRGHPGPQVGYNFKFLLISLTPISLGTERTDG